MIYMYYAVGCSRRSFIMGLLFLGTAIGCNGRAPRPTPSRPASLQECKAAFDGRKMPRLPNATVTTNQHTWLVFTAPATVESAKQFYLQELRTLGWQPVESPGWASSATPHFGTSLTKNGFWMVLNIGAAPRKPGQIFVSLHHLGNVDVRTLPIMRAETLCDGGASYVAYIVPVDVDAAVEYARTELRALGWQEYEEAFQQPIRKPDQQSWLFRQNGIGLKVDVTTKTERRGETALIYSASVLFHEIPTTADARQVRYVDASPYLNYQSPSIPRTIQEFYEQELPKLGWTVEDSGSLPPSVVPPEIRGLPTFSNEDGIFLILELKPGVSLTDVSLHSVHLPNDSKASPEEAETVPRD